MDEEQDYPLIDTVAPGLNTIPSAISRKRNGFSRQDVVNALHNAFHMIGGVNRLTLWADENPDKFFPLYARLMPSNTINIAVEGDKIIIEHAIAPTPLDEHPTK